MLIFSFNVLINFYNSLIAPNFLNRLFLQGYVFTIDIVPMDLEDISDLNRVNRTKDLSSRGGFSSTLMFTVARFFAIASASSRSFYSLCERCLRFSWSIFFTEGVARNCHPFGDQQITAIAISNFNDIILMPQIGYVL